MATRSLAATAQGLDTATKALTSKGWCKEDLAAEVVIQGRKTIKGISPGTVKNFFSGKSVDRKYFVGICTALKVDWEVIAGLKNADSHQTLGAKGDNDNIVKTDIDALVQDIRQKVKADIQDRCGKMRVLDMEQPIGIGDIYTSVNILEKLSGRRRLGISELLQDCDLENFDRFRLGQVHHERVPGQEAVERYDKLMILGKPGAGKTTFMKRLATLCNQGEFQRHRVPVFVTLKEFAEAKGQPDLQAYIAKQWRASKVKNTKALAEILGQGRALVLLDGLDEVQETEHDRILQEIKDFIRQFRPCQFVMTCRIAAREYTFQQFTEVEVADFNQEQIAEFAKKWFKSKQDPEKGQNFIKRLEGNKPIQELATNPLLLTLLCLVFGEGNNFPHNRSDLYKEGLDILLKKWDAKRNIERDQVYKKLSLKRKEDLLSQLALMTFENNEYFFKQRFVERHIIEYIRNLSSGSRSELELQLESEAVLKSIEAQHGLLVERARGIYSFSHLTFQEYFTARQIVSPISQLPSVLKNLVTHIPEKRYREVFLLAVGMLPEADELLMLMKQQIDLLIANDSALQFVLTWVCKKSKSVHVSYKPAAIRAFYFTLACTHEITRTRNIDLVRDIDITLALETILDCSIASGITCDHNLVYILALKDDITFDVIRDQDIVYDIAYEQYRIITRTFDYIFEASKKNDPDLKLRLSKLRAQLPNPEDLNVFRQWWKMRGGAWIDKLISLMIEYRNVGHDWQFTNTQKEGLQQYYDANKLLIECLNSDCYVTKETRQHIEETLLLPLSEIERRNSEVGSRNLESV